MPCLAGCRRKHADKGSKLNFFRTPQQVLRKQTEAPQYMRWARTDLASTVKAGQRIQCDLIKRTLKATVHEVIYCKGPHAHSELTSITDGTVI